jgi:hypothetical protein
MQITTFNPLQCCPADEKANNNGSAITILTQYVDLLFRLSERVSSRVISFLFSYFFSNLYFKRSKEFSKFTGKFGRATV